MGITVFSAAVGFLVELPAGMSVLAHLIIYAPVAQLDRALPSGGRGQGFESLRAHQLSPSKTSLYSLIPHPHATISLILGIGNNQCVRLNSF